MIYKLGSLFDGSGGFPLAGTLCGIEPVWAAEIEPYPIAVTREKFNGDPNSPLRKLLHHQFPNMRLLIEHLGDISKVNGGEIEPVDIITFGSPCQDLSVAGKRAGLKHEANGDEETTRSGLFMEAVRIIKEMRKATNGQYPRFALWENVPGAFSSNKGEDFRIVCEELIKIIEPSASMPPVPKGGWTYADSYLGDGWSLAYRVFDAQYWGVPQRRRRIYLVADFRGKCAQKVLFEREGVRGYFAQSRTPWQTTPADAQGSPGADDREGTQSNTLDGGRKNQDSDSYVRDRQGSGRDGGLDAVGILNAIGGNAESCQVADTFPTLTNGTAPGRTNAVTYTMKIRSGCDVDSRGKSAGKGALIQTDKAATLSTVQDQYLFQPVADTHIIDNVGGQAEYAKASSVNGTLRAGAQGLVAYAVENHPADSRVNLDESGKVQTLTSRMGTGGGNVPMVMEPFCKSARAQSADDATTWKPGKVANTLNTFDQGEARANELVVEEKPVICLQGNGIDRPAVAYQATVGSLCARDYKGVGSQYVNEDKLVLDRGVAYSLDEKMGQTYTWEEQANTLAARDYKQPQAVGYEQGLRYIVRRLTPTECARLQGFADWWSFVDKKDSLTDEEYRFWMEVRNTHAAINGRKVQDYTKKQMLTWYNKLYTDSAEYKMWGNGIALPTALYVLQGLTDALNTPLNTEEAVEEWML